MEIRGERPIPGYYYQPVCHIRYNDDFTMQLIHITYASVTCTMADCNTPRPPHVTASGQKCYQHCAKTTSNQFTSQQARFFSSGAQTQKHIHIAAY